MVKPLGGFESQQTTVLRPETPGLTLLAMNSHVTGFAFGWVEVTIERFTLMTICSLTVDLYTDIASTPRLILLGC
jgi:hypothetical protein